MFAALSPCAHNLCSTKGLFNLNTWRQQSPVQDKFSMPSRGPKSRRSRRTGLHAYLEHTYASRWPRLHSALVAPTSHVALFNAFAACNDLAAQAPLLGLAWPPVLNIPDRGVHCTKRTCDVGPYPPPPRDADSGLCSVYWLDMASVLPPVMLDIRPGQRIVDMCAAPGGKTLLLAMQLFGERPRGTQRSSVSRPPSAQGALIANEADAARFRRLQAVLADYLPAELLSWRGGTPAVRVTNHPAETYWRRHDEEAFDRVLLDAPCSSDRHLLQQAAATTGSAARAAEWSTASSAKAACTQLALLTAALRALAPGGRLVYSTCSMARMENDDVVTTALAKMPPGAVRVVHPLQQPNPQEAAPISASVLRSHFGAEDTQHGVLVLPDVHGSGPMFVAVLHKVASTAGYSPADRLGLCRIVRSAVPDESDDSTDNIDVPGSDDSEAC